ncbi:MAG: tetratricopeptide repeat protein [Flavobacteriales bacterium]
MGFFIDTDTLPQEKFGMCTGVAWWGRPGRNMKAFLFCIAWLIVSFASSGQAGTKLRASLLFDRASTHAARQEWKDALRCFDEAFTLDPWQAPYYYEAFSAALAMGDTARANEMLRAGVHHGFNPEVWTGDKKLVGFLAGPSSTPFRAHWDEDKRAFTVLVDTTFISELDSMVIEDQRFRAEEWGPQMHLVDSLNFEGLIHHFDHYGLPDPPTLRAAYGNLFLLLWHHRGPEYPGSPQWQRVLPHIRKAIDEGLLEPSFLCMFDDFSDHERGLPMRYGALLYYFSALPESLYFVDWDTLTSNRASVGWGPIEDFAIQMGVSLSNVRFAPKP